MKAGNADPLYGLDISEEAVLKARVNAEAAGITIHYINRDVRDFRHEYLFDEIVSDLPLTGRSRNLLELTELYSAFFKRVPELLKKGGRLLNFDANWYRYLCDEELRKGYEEDRKKTKEQQVEDYYEGTDIAEMERIAAAVPLTEILRPAWDLHVMEEIGFQDCRSDETVNERILSRADQINGESTPMFLVTGRK